VGKGARKKTVDSTGVLSVDDLRGLLSKLNSMASEGERLGTADPHYMPLHQACKAKLEVFYERSSYDDIHLVLSHVFYNLNWFALMVGYRSVERMLEAELALKILTGRSHRDFFLTIKRYLYNAMLKWPQNNVSKPEGSLGVYNHHV
jgi:hypothetical protein